MADVEQREPASSGRKSPKTFEPASLAVDPALAGRPLASPWRRLLALLVDLTLIGALTLSGAWTFSALCAAVVLWLTVRLGSRAWQRVLLAGVGLVAAFFTFLAALSLTWDGPEYGPDVDWVEFTRVMASGDAGAQVRAAEALEAQMEDGWSEARLAGMLEGFGVEMDGVTSAEDPAPLDAGQVLDLLESQAEVLRGGGPGAVEEVRAALRPWVAGRELEAARQKRLQVLRDYAELTSENQELRDRLDHPSARYLLSAVAADLGLTVGWSSLYFTLFLALAGGRTPGKRLLRIRVVRIDGRPMNVWTSFERFAGYAAGLATGLLGFLQVFWNRNRRAVQDTLSGTVVLDDQPSGRG